MVQGLTLTGPDVFGTETANNMLNSFTSRIDLKAGGAIMFDQLFQFFELFTSWMMQLDKSKHANQIDTAQIVLLANSKYVLPYLDAVGTGISCFELSCLYWMYQQLSRIEDNVWDT